MATVKVLLFARLAELAGAREMQLDIGEGLTAGDAYRLLVERNDSLAGFEASIAYAINREYVGAEAALRDGDELALIPPVSGGSGRCRGLAHQGVVAAQGGSHAPPLDGRDVNLLIPSAGGNPL